jgi:hypothetical protein
MLTEFSEGKFGITDLETDLFTIWETNRMISTDNEQGKFKSEHTIVTEH